MTKYEEHVQRIRSKVKADCCMLEDGYVGYWPLEVRGYMTADDLRIVADYLDERNKEWDEHIKATFSE